MTASRHLCRWKQTKCRSPPHRLKTSYESEKSFFRKGSRGKDLASQFTLREHSAKKSTSMRLHFHCPQSATSHRNLFSTEASGEISHPIAPKYQITPTGLSRQDRKCQKRSLCCGTLSLRDPIYWQMASDLQASASGG